MRKIRLVYLWILLLNIAIFIPAHAAPSTQVAVNGQIVPFPDEQPYLDETSQRMMVPVKFVAEYLGAHVQWNAQLNEVIIAYRDQTLYLTIGQNMAILNGTVIHFDAPAVIKNNRTMVPLRFVSEIFGAQVQWLPERDLVNIKTEQKATWIWDSRILETEQDKILNFAADHRLTAIYLHIDKDVRPNVYQSFVRRANEIGILVEALAGKPSWASPSNQGLIQEFITWVQRYNASVDPDERFRGLHFDIEPYLLDEWQTNPRLVIQNWMDSLRFIEKEAKGVGLPGTLDIPFWLYTINIPGTNDTLSTWTLQRFDRLVLMDYRNQALGNDGIVANAKTILEEASRWKKSVMLGVDTTKGVADERTTFFSLGEEAMEKELKTAKEGLSTHASFAGYAIHDYKNWAVME